MKIIIAVAIVSLLGLVFFFGFGDEPQVSTLPTTNNTPTNNTNDDDNYKRVQDDALSVAESNALLARQVQDLAQSLKTIQDKLKQLENKQQKSNANDFVINRPPSSQQVGHSPPITPTPTSTKNNKSTEDKSQSKSPAVQAIEQQVGGLVKNFPINNGGTDNGGQDPEIIWLNAILSSTQTVATSTTTTDNTVSEEASNIVPKYTIPPNSILGGIAKTALLGRIPINNKVTGPFRFLIRITDRSLFPSFKAHNELKGMEMSGTAQGDLLLSCVKGKIDSVTFIFEDETISQVNGVELAEITDEYGFPCIKGTLITNAPQTIGISTGLSFLGSVAKSLAGAEQTVVTSAEGNTTRSTTGNATKLAGYSGLSEGIDNINEWVADRAKSSFDVIKVLSGKPIKIMVTKAIEIDYDKVGRKLRHKQAASNYGNKTLD